MVYIRPISYVTSIGLALICVPKVPVGNAENYRVRSLQLPEITAFPVHSKTPIIPAEIVHIMLIQKDVISAIFLGKFLSFPRNRTSATINDLRGRHPWRSGKTLCLYRHSWHANQAYPIQSVFPIEQEPTECEAHHRSCRKNWPVGGSPR
jgi:hypothetical protein